MRWSCLSFSWVNSAHCSRCVCTWMGQMQRTNFTAGYTLYNYVCKKKKNLNRYFFFFTKPITDYGKMLKYREKYRSTDISVDLYLWLSKCEKHHQNSPSAIVHLIWLLWSCSYFSGPWQCYLLASQWDSHKPPSFHPKYLKLCSEDEQSFYGFGMT